MKRGTNKMLILRKKIVDVIKLWIMFGIGKVVYWIDCSYNIYKIRNDGTKYEFQKSCLEYNDIEDKIDYVSKTSPNYKVEQLSIDVEKSAQYYIYSRIERMISKNEPIKVCNIGCFYCGADTLFLKKNKNSKVYGLDFGNIIKLNSNIKNKRLLLYEGYPLKTLLELHENNVKFDFAIMARTATLINSSQLFSYIEVLSKMAKRIIFLEVGKLTVSLTPFLNIRNISLYNPVRMYGGMYIHNYPKLLEKYGYSIVEEKIVNARQFSNKLSKDHDFIYVCGEKDCAEVVDG